MAPSVCSAADVAGTAGADHAACSNTGVVMVTARGQASDIESGMAVGADAYFPKPFSPLKLLAFLREHYR